MRNKQAIKNMTANMMLQIIVFFSGIILPRFFLEAYGSSVNGLVTSIDQFLIYLGLAEAGIGNASVVALYKPLAEEDDNKVNSVLSATRRFYNRSGFIFMGMVIVLVLVYPHFIKQQIGACEVRSMIIVLASSTLIDFFFLGKYKVYLTANQQGYIVVIAQAVGTILNMGIIISLINIGLPAVVVKTTTPIIYALRFLIIKKYVQRKVPLLDFSAMPDIRALNQRKAALIHQIVGIIVNNTDVVLLTVLLGSKSLLEVSVYGIYNMVVYAVNLFFSSFSNGLAAGFGEVIFKREKEVLYKSYSDYEFIYFIVLFVICTCMTVLLLPFIAVYTIGISDAQYYRPIVAGLFSTIVFMQNVRIPSITMILAAGHFEETKRPAIIEAVINIVISILLIKRWGMVGVLFGTVSSYLYRSTQTIWYTQKYIVKGSGRRTIIRLCRNFALSVIIIIGGYYIIPQNMTSFFTWILWAVLLGCISLIFFILINFLFEPIIFFQICKRFKESLRRNNG